MDGRGLVTVRIVGTRNVLDVGTGVELKSCLKRNTFVKKTTEQRIKEDKLE